jgi:hypothetical protein
MTILWGNGALKWQSFDAFWEKVKKSSAGELMCSRGFHGAVRSIKVRKTKWRNAVGQWFWNLANGTVLLTATCRGRLQVEVGNTTVESECRLCEMQRMISLRKSILRTCCIKLASNRAKLYINFLLSANTKHQNITAQQAERAAHHLRTTA